MGVRGYYPPSLYPLPPGEGIKIRGEWGDLKIYFLYFALCNFLRDHGEIENGF
jgi:hypothetical protein